MAAESAFGCSMVYINPFAELADSSVSSAISSAAYVDWVEVEIDGPPACPAPRRLTKEEWAAMDAAWEAWEAMPEPKPPPPEDQIPQGPRRTVEGHETMDCQFTVPTGPFHTPMARVIESLRGGASGRFPLVLPRFGSNPWRAFADPRVRMQGFETRDEEFHSACH
ncbi:MAG: hypothetical protein ACOY4K_08360 [Pseudomonadota bacterium]